MPRRSSQEIWNFTQGICITWIIQNDSDLIYWYYPDDDIQTYKLHISWNRQNPQATKEIQGYCAYKIIDQLELIKDKSHITCKHLTS